MRKLILSSFIVLILSVFAIAETHAQSQTFEIRNCTDIDLCAVASWYLPSPSGCTGATFTLCLNPVVPAGTVVNITVSDINCRYLLVRNPAGSGSITSDDSSGPFGDDYCACWDYSGANPVLTIYEGDCVTPCPAPDCP